MKCCFCNPSCLVREHTRNTKQTVPQQQERMLEPNFAQREVRVQQPVLHVLPKPAVPERRHQRMRHRVQLRKITIASKVLVNMELGPRTFPSVTLTGKIFLTSHQRFSQFANRQHCCAQIYVPDYWAHSQLFTFLPDRCPLSTATRWSADRRGPCQSERDCAEPAGTAASECASQPSCSCKSQEHTASSGGDFGASEFDRFKETRILSFLKGNRRETLGRQNYSKGVVVTALSNLKCHIGVFPTENEDERTIGLTC